MAKTNAVRKDKQEREETVSLGDRASDNLKYIRETMERSTAFTAVPGYGGILVVAAYIANEQVTVVGSLRVWLAEAFLAFAIGLLTMWQKAKLGGQSLFSAPARKFAFNFLPPLAGQRFGHSDALHVPHKANHQRRRQQLLPQT